jgi:hypothetical protein
MGCRTICTGTEFKSRLYHFSNSERPSARFRLPANSIGKSVENSAILHNVPQLKQHKTMQPMIKLARAIHPTPERYYVTIPQTFCHVNASLSPFHLCPVTWPN